MLNCSFTCCLYSHNSRSDGCASTICFHSYEILAFLSSRIFSSCWYTRTPAIIAGICSICTGVLENDCISSTRFFKARPFPKNFLFASSYFVWYAFISWCKKTSCQFLHNCSFLTDHVSLAATYAIGSSNSLSTLSAAKMIAGIFSADTILWAQRYSSSHSCSVCGCSNDNCNNSFSAWSGNEINACL